MRRSSRAAVELEDGWERSPDLAGAICSFARERLAGYKVPRAIDFEERLPRYPTGKLHVRELRDRHWKGRGRNL